MKKAPRYKIAKWMVEAAANYLIDELTSDGRACDIESLRTHVEFAATQHWLPLMETKRLQHQARSVIKKKAQSKRLIWCIRRHLRDAEQLPTHLVSARYYDAEEHWDDAEYMFSHRQEFVPCTAYPAVAVVVADFDPHAASAALERLGKGGTGVNKHIKISSIDAENRDVLSEEALEEIGQSCGQAELLKKRLWEEKVFQKSFLRAVNGG